MKRGEDDVAHSATHPTSRAIHRARYVSMLRFFVPLGLTSLLIHLNHFVISLGLTRLPSPETGIAAFAVAKAVILLIENPLQMLRQAVVSLIRDEASYRVTAAAARGLIFGLALALFVVGYSPLGVWVLREIMGVQGEVLTQGAAALRILWVLPIAAGFRNFYQGLSILGRSTATVPLATAARLVAVSLILWGFVSHGGVPAAVVGSFAFVSSFVVEASIAFVGASKTRRLALRGTDDEEARAEPPLTLGRVVRFYIPLVATSFMLSFMEPTVNAGLARTLSPEKALAAFAVGWSLVNTLGSPIHMAQQIGITFTHDGAAASYRRSWRLITYLGVGFSVLTLLVGRTPAGPWLIGTVMGAPDTIREPALELLRWGFLIPLIVSQREYCWGVLMRKHRTALISQARVVGLIVMAGCIVGGLGFPWSNPALLGLLSIACSWAVESVWLLWRTDRIIESEDAS